MSTAFYGLHIAKTGLFASQKGLEVVGNNVANATTKGYSRQRVDLASIPALYGGGGKLAPITTSLVGAGVSIRQVEQLRDQYLDSQLRSENSILGEWTVRADAMYYIEDLFNDTGDAGIDDVLSALFSTFEELSKSPESEEIRVLVRQQAISFAKTMNYYATQMEKLQVQQNDLIKTTVERINTLVTQISDYNEQIVRFERSGGNANELRDMRNVALDELSSILDIKYSESATGEITVTFGEDDMVLVDSSGANTLSLVQDLPSYYGESNAFYSIFTSSGQAVTADNLGSGRLKGYLDMRDGNESLNAGIPYFLSKLDALAAGIAEAVNEAHRAGYTIPSDENGNVSQTGINFFDIGSHGAKTLSVDSRILESVYNIAASSKEITGSGNMGNNENALLILDVLNRNDISVITNIEQYLKGIVSDVAVNTSYANGRVESQSFLVDNIEYKRMSVSGVSLDEEMTNMITFQKSYNAAARLITAIDQMLDTLINSMGIVGR